MIIIGFQFPYAMILGWEFYTGEDELPYKYVALHLLILTLEIRWDDKSSE